MSGASLDALVSSVEDELVERIPAAVAEVGYREPVCALALAYCRGEFSLPPGMILCPEAVRRRLADEGNDDFWYRWHAAEWRAAGDVPELDGCGGDEFLERCRTTDRQIARDGDERLGARLLQAVARRLNGVDWSDLLLVTGDFVIYAWEIHGEALDEDLAASTPAGAAPRR